MSVYVESGIRFDFGAAFKVVEYEALVSWLPGVSPTARNTFWPGIDFYIEDAPDEAIWLEVKSWNPARLAPKDRGGNRRSFLGKMKSNAFAQEMRGKFLGASSYFAWNSQPLPSSVRFLLLFEPPRSIDSALILTFGQKINSQLMPPRALTWHIRISVAALPLDEWNLRFPEFPAANL